MFRYFMASGMKNNVDGMTWSEREWRKVSVHGLEIQWKETKDY